MRYKSFEFFSRHATPHIPPIVSIYTAKIGLQTRTRGSDLPAHNAVNAPLIYYASLHSRLSFARFIRVIYHRDLFPGTQRGAIATIAFLREGAVHNGLWTVGENCHTHDIIKLREDTNYPFLRSIRIRPPDPHTLPRAWYFRVERDCAWTIRENAPLANAAWEMVTVSAWSRYIGSVNAVAPSSLSSVRPACLFLSIDTFTPMIRPMEVGLESARNHSTNACHID